MPITAHNQIAVWSLSATQENDPQGHGPRKRTLARTAMDTGTYGDVKAQPFLHNSVGR